MLILLSPELLPSLPKLVQRPDFIEALDNLSILFRKGYHIVSGPPSLIEELLPHLKHKPDIQGALKQIKSGHHQELSLRAKMKHAIVVGPSNEQAVQVRQDGEQIRYHVSYRYFTRLRMARFVAEDMNDIHIYEGATRAYLWQNKRELKEIRLVLEKVAGGGGRTPGQFREQASQGPTLCILDSDQRYPEGPLGNTAKDVCKVATELAGKQVCHTEVLPCHELENLIPPNLLLDCQSKDASKKYTAAWQQAAYHGLLCADPSLAYIDMKKGISGHDIINAPSQKQRTYLQSVAQRLPALGQVCDPHPHCCDQHQRGCKKPENTCTCFNIQGIGEGALERVAQWVEQASEQKLAESFFSAGHASLWQPLVELLLAFGCAFAPRKL